MLCGVTKHKPLASTLDALSLREMIRFYWPTTFSAEECSFSSKKDPMTIPLIAQTWSNSGALDIDQVVHPVKFTTDSPNPSFFRLKSL